MRRERVATLAIFASAFAFGFLSVLTKLALEAGARPLPLTAWRFTIAAALVWLVVGVSHRRRPSARAIVALFALGAIYAVDALSFTFALRWVPASTATLIFYTYPVVVIVLAAMLLDERLTSRRLVAVALAVIGCGLLVGIGAQGVNPIGVALVLLAVAALSLYLVSGRKVLPALPAVGSAAVIITATAIVSTAAATGAGQWQLGGGGRAIVYMLLLAVFSTALPITLLAIGLRYVDAGRASIYSTIEPIITVIAASFILGERIGPFQYLGGALILAAVAWLRLERPLPQSEYPTPFDSP